MSPTIQEKIAELGSARLLGNFENNSPEWHALRAQGIGGSEVSTICGLNPWESAYTLWAKKTGQIPSVITPSEAMEWGTRLEPVVLDKFADEHPELIVHRNVGTFCHVDREWQIANPDAIYELADGTLGVVEVKTARFEDDWRDGVPPYYRTQVLWYLQTLGLQHATVIVLFSGSKYREFSLTADAWEQDTNLQAVTEFRKYVVDNVKPDFSAPMLSTYETVREQHPDIDADAEVEVGNLGQIYADAAFEATRAEEMLNEVRARILDAMGTAKRGLVNGEWRFTRQARNGGTPFLIVKKG